MLLEFLFGDVLEALVVRGLFGGDVVGGELGRRSRFACARLTSTLRDFPGATIVAPGDADRFPSSSPATTPQA